MPDAELDLAAFYDWTYTCELSGKRKRTRWKMTPADALASQDLIDPQPILLSKELRGKGAGGAGDVRRPEG